MIRLFSRRVDLPLYLMASPPVMGIGSLEAEPPPLPLAIVGLFGFALGGFATQRYLYAEKTGVVSHLNETLKGMKTKFGVTS